MSEHQLQVFDQVGIAITNPEGSAFTTDQFNIVRETLQRIGVKSHKTRKFIQSIHIFHKRGQYKLLHFKELFLIDGKLAEITEEDIFRRNLVAKMLSKWGLIQNSVDHLETGDVVVDVLPHNQKADWILEAKYTLGKKLR